MVESNKVLRPHHMAPFSMAAFAKNYVPSASNVFVNGVKKTVAHYKSLI